MRKADRVYFHFLEDLYCYIILFLIRKKKTYWLLWGADLYNRIDYELYDEYTKKILLELGKNIKRNKSKLNKKIERLAIQKISYIGTIIDGDYKLISKNFNVYNNRLQFFYTNPLKFDEYPSRKERNSEINILIGNSGDPSNNHFTVLNSLRVFKGIKVLCPLSYGDPDYISRVIEYGKSLFGNSFIPLIEFMNETDYLAVLDSIDVAIMNHFRQQALGNIFAILSLGKPLFINSESPVFDFLLQHGITVQDTKKILKGEVFTFSPNSKEIRISNYLAVKELNSEKVAIEYIKNLYK